MCGPVRCYSDNIYELPICSSFIVVPLYWRGGSSLRTLFRNQQIDSKTSETINWNYFYFHMLDGPVLTLTG